MRIPVASWVLVRFPRQRQEAFFSLLGESDVLLDSIHSFGGTTTFDSFAVGTPLVKWPGMFARGRFTLACCQNKDVMDCVASSLEEYAELALLLGNNREERDAVKQKIWLRIILFLMITSQCAIGRLSSKSPLTPPEKCLEKPGRLRGRDSANRRC